MSTSHSRNKQTWFPRCLMPIGTIQQSDNVNTQSTVLTNSNVLVVGVVNREWRWQQIWLNSVFIPCLLVSLKAEVLVVVTVLGCMRGSWPQVSAFSCHPPPPSDTECQWGFVLILGQVTQYGKPYSFCITMWQSNELYTRNSFNDKLYGFPGIIALPIQS